jgi:hypothetical protein
MHTISKLMLVAMMMAPAANAADSPIAGTWRGKS